MAAKGTLRYQLPPAPFDTWSNGKGYNEDFKGYNDDVKGCNEDVKGYKLCRCFEVEGLSFPQPQRRRLGFAFTMARGC
eukprot:8404747-Pyramimonas_sp.AAC.2